VSCRRESTPFPGADKERIGDRLKGESPLAEHVGRVIRRRKKAFHFDCGVKGVGKRLELPLVHVAAVKLGKTMAYPCHLRGAFRDGEHKMVSPIVHLESNDHGPGKILKGTEEAFQAFLGYGKPRDEIFRGHACNLPPHDFIEMLGGGSIVLILYGQKPEAVHNPVVPEQKSKIAAKFLLIHGFEYSKIHATLHLKI
jgi:hypothetical protein